MPLVPAICTQCGSQIEVDNTQEAGICRFCGTAFITEKVINNYTINNTIKVENASINVSSVNVDNLIKRALEFESNGDTEKAIEYYNRVLDEDVDNSIAREHIKDLTTPKTITISGITLSQEQGAEITNSIKIGEKVHAIKLLREFSGLGLKEAKDAIDLYISQNNPSNHSNTILNNGSNNQQNSTKNNSGCYIATCVYGSYDCPEVWTLRRFRDYTLDKTWYGRLFIKCYYTISPIIVKWFGETKWFKTLWKAKLDKMVSNLNRNGIENTRYKDKY